MDWQILPSLIAQLKSDRDDMNVSAAQRLAIFRDRTAAPALAERLGHGSREARVAAAVALAACGTRASTPPLLAALTDADPLVAQAAVLALENLTGHTEAFDAFAETDERSRQAQAWRDWFRARATATILSPSGGEVIRGTKRGSILCLRRIRAPCKP